MGWRHGPAAVPSKDPRAHDSEPRPNVDPDQVHLVVTLTELDILVDALRSVGNIDFADRLEHILRQFGRARRPAQDA